MRPQTISRPQDNNNDEKCVLCKQDVLWHELEFDKCRACHKAPLRNQKVHVLFNTLRRASEKDAPVDPSTLKALVPVLESEDHPPLKFYSTSGFFFYEGEAQRLLRICKDPNVTCQCDWCKR